MIVYLSGTTQYADLDAICINVGGVGYHVLMPLTDVARSSKPGTKLEAYIHTHVREDALQLYGFSTRAGLSLFERLLSVSGVGPRLALALLSGLAAEVLVRAIAERDEARLTKVPGVGKKTAQRILLELGDKMARESLSSVLSTSSPLAGQQRVIDDLRSALANLGYKAPQIDRAVQKVKLTMTSAEAASDEGQDLSLLLREALKHVS